MLHCLPYTGHLPAGFELLTQAPHPTGEPPAAELCAHLAPEFDIIFYTDYRSFRLAGLFPKNAADGTAYFGFWETPDEPALNLEAFGLLRAEARRRRLWRVCGPLHFSAYFRYRLRLGKVPSWGQFEREPVNPLYYAALLAEAGFRPGLTFESRRLRAEAVPPRYCPPIPPRLAARFEFIALGAQVWAALEDEIFALIQQVVGQQAAYRPVSQAQFRLLYNARYAAGLCPHSSGLLRHRASGQLAALSLCQPHYQLLGLPPGTSPSFAEHYPQLPAPRVLLVNLVGVHPCFRGKGLLTMLTAYAMRGFLEYYNEMIFCMLRAGSRALRFADGLPAEVAYYALFEQEA